MILVCGSLNADLVVRVPHAPTAGETVTGDHFEVFGGGKGANQAYAVARLGGAVKMVGRVGDDAYGRMQIEQLEAVGVNTVGITRMAELPTGTAIILVEESGENRIVVVPGANAALSIGDVLACADAWHGIELALFQLETPIEVVGAGLRAAKAAGVCTILDPAPAQALSDDLLSQVDILTPNRLELARLTGRAIEAFSSLDSIEAACRVLLDRGVGAVLAKLGADGALLVSREPVRRIEAFAVNPVDTTAAGDCFNGAFATALAAGRSRADAGRFASAAAALAVTRVGAQPSMPSLAEVEALLGPGSSE